MRTTDIDLAGDRFLKPQYLQNRARINKLVNNYLAINVLSDRLSNITEQFVRPQPRPWQPINWQAINQEQIIGVEPEIFYNLSPERQKLKIRFAVMLKKVDAI